MTLWLLAALALADTWAPFLGDFLTPQRDAVPTDARPVIASNYDDLSVTAAMAGAEPVALEIELLKSGGTTSDPGAVAILPPDGGWPAGAGVVLDVSVPDEASPDERTFTFTAGDALSAAPALLVVGDVAYGPWQEDTTYPGGCCADVRTVTLEVTAAGADPWALAELSVAGGEVLDVEVLDDGAATVSWVQWTDGGAAQPECVALTQIGAAGDLSEPVALCADASGDLQGVGTGCGCASVGRSPGGLVGLLLLLVGALRMRSARSRVRAARSSPG